MEAAQAGRREPDVAPAPESRVMGWTPADPGPLGLAAFAGTTFVLSLVNAGLVGPESRRWWPVADGGRAGARLWRCCPVHGRRLGVPDRQHVRRGGVLLLRRVLDLVLLHRPVGGQERANRGIQRPRALPLDVGHLHRLHVHRFAENDRCRRAVFLLLAITFIILGIGNSSLAGTLSVTNSTIKLGGWVGLITALVAWYASFAGVINSTFGRVIAPVVPLRR